MEKVENWKETIARISKAVETNILLDGLKGVLYPPSDKEPTNER